MKNISCGKAYVGSALALALAWALGSVSLKRPLISAWCGRRLGFSLDLFAVRLQKASPHLVAFEDVEISLPYRLSRIETPEQQALLWLLKRRHQAQQHTFVTGPCGKTMLARALVAASGPVAPRQTDTHPI